METITATETVTDISQLCRVCLNDGVYLATDYLLATKDRKFTANCMIEVISTKVFPESSKIPSKICESCSEGLIQSFIFLDKLRITEKHIEEMLSYMEDQDECEDGDNSAEEIQIECEETASESGTMPEDDYVELDVGDAVVNQTPINDHNYYENHETIVDDDDDNNYSESRISEIQNIKEEQISDDQVTTAAEDDVATAMECSNVSLSTVEKVAIVNDFFHKPNKYSPTRKRRRGEPITHEDISEGNSFIVSAFVPIAAGSAKPYVDDTVDKDSDESVNERSGALESKIRTLDFAHVEVSSSNDIKIGDLPEDNELNDGTFYKCKYCPKAFASPHFLRAHLSRTHICQYCTEVFEKVQQLSEHMRLTHTKFSCVICKKEFKCNSYLRTHIRMYHNVKLPKNVFLVSVNKKNDT